MNATNCPFCGVVTDVPHNTQEGCIEALHHEISRLRQILEQVRAPAPAGAEFVDDPEEDIPGEG